MDVLVVGAGAIGRWFAETIPWPTAFADIDESAARASASALDDRGSVAALDGEDAFDLVTIAVPMRVAGKSIRSQAPRARRAIVDLTGSMVVPLTTMAEEASDVERISYHPLFAPEHAPGRIAYSIGQSGPVTDEINAHFDAAGNDLYEVDADVHDEAMKTVQGRAHAAILAFALAAAEVPPELSTPVFERLHALVERVTDGSPGVYADIQERFDGAEAIGDAADRLAEADRTGFEALYRDAGR